MKCISMKHTYIIAGSVLAAVPFVLPGLAQIEPETAPEFYFTRLVYKVSAERKEHTRT
jgi:hypothetical protein